MEPVGNFEQLFEIDDLVVAPITDIRPGVIGGGDFPFDAIAGDPVGVIAVHGGGIQEFADHLLDKLRIRPGQRLPVLENIPPVALVIQFLRSVRLFEIDREAVPGTAGVAVPAAKGQRQVLITQPLQLCRTG